jgi:hypothetical protein
MFLHQYISLAKRHDWHYFNYIYLHNIRKRSSILHPRKVYCSLKFGFSDAHFLPINKRKRKPDVQSKIDNNATLSAQDTGRRQTRQRHKQKHNRENYKVEQNEPIKNYR